MYIRSFGNEPVPAITLRLAAVHRTPRRKFLPLLRQQRCYSRSPAMLEGGDSADGGG
eukprot:COSAG01_NODE_62806_length_282_cov_18.781421_1_plen_56_part_01